MSVFNVEINEQMEVNRRAGVYFPLLFPTFFSGLRQRRGTQLDSP